MTPTRSALGPLTRRCTTGALRTGFSLGTADGSCLTRVQRTELLHLRVSTARRVADIFWPAFVERDGVVLLPFVRPPESPPGRHHATLTDYERFHSHSHIQDLFRWEVPMLYDAELDLERPDASSKEHAAAWDLAQRLGAMWFAKLRTDFPGDRFRVYVTRLEDPIVHFHRVRPGERLWISDEEGAEQVARGDLVILDSRARSHT